MPIANVLHQHGDTSLASVFPGANPKSMPQGDVLRSPPCSPFDVDRSLSPLLLSLFYTTDNPGDVLAGPTILTSNVRSRVSHRQHRIVMFYFLRIGWHSPGRQRGLLTS